MVKEVSILEELHYDIGNTILYETIEDELIFDFIFPQYKSLSHYPDLTDEEKVLLNNLKKELSIFQDIISIWFKKRIEGDRQNEFDITEIGNYLLKNNIYLMDEFKGEHIPFSNRLQKKRSFIEKRIEMLKKFQILEITTTKKSSKKNPKLEKDVYEFTIDGKIISWLIACKREESESHKYVEILAHDFFDLLLRLDSGLSTRLMVDYFKLSMKENEHEIVINFFENIIHYINPSHFYELKLWFLRLISINNDSIIFKKVLDTYDKKTRELVLFQIKMDIECSIGLFIHGKFKHDWEIRRYKNIENPYIITSIGRCLECNTDIAETVNLLEFIDIEGNSCDTLLTCNKCSSNKIFDLTFFDLFDRYYTLKNTIETVYDIT